MENIAKILQGKTISKQLKRLAFVTWLDSELHVQVDYRSVPTGP